ncbi:hypothetical protein CL628_01435 [bacterium]|nr:hypothetical protein [bacterium]
MLATKRKPTLLVPIDGVVRVIILGPGIDVQVGTGGGSGAGTTAVERAITDWRRSQDRVWFIGQRLWPNDRFPFRIVSLATDQQGNQALTVQPKQSWKSLLLRVAELERRNS